MFSGDFSFPCNWWQTALFVSIAILDRVWKIHSSFSQFPSIVHHRGRSMALRKSFSLLRYNKKFLFAWIWILSHFQKMAPLKPILCVRKVCKFFVHWYSIGSNGFYLNLRDVEGVFFAWKENQNVTVQKKTR